MKATEFKTIAKDAASNQLAQAFAAAKTESEPAFNPQRRAYQGETLLSANRSVSCDTWRSGLNNNVLVLGSSGGGKTRNHVKPNLLQCQGSYIVLDCKGSLYHEMGPYLEENDYIVDCIDFNAMDGTSIGSLTNPPKIEATFKSVLNSKITANTISTYISYLEESFLIEEARRYDVKGRKYIGSPKKYYFEDIGLRNARLGFRQVEETRIMENIVYNELRARGFSVDVGSVAKARRVDGKVVRKQLEVDFVANLGSRRYYIQSALHLPDEEKTRQEKAPLREVPDSFSKIVLVRDVVKPTYDNEGILTMSVFDFLLDEESLPK